MSSPTHPATGKNDDLLHVCICTHDKSEDLVSCLRALREQAADLPIVVVDSASSAPQRSAVEAISSTYDAKVIRLETPGRWLAMSV
jgi:glycosyltransferase involved in cell wall biosynthesis